MREAKAKRRGNRAKPTSLLRVVATWSVHPVVLFVVPLLLSGWGIWALTTPSNPAVRFWLGVGLLVSMPVTIFFYLAWLHLLLRRTHLQYMVRIFQEKPLFIVPRGTPVDGAEEVRFPGADGLRLCGVYLKATPPAGSPRRGVILFGLEFGSNRWACVPYCEHLLAAGYDVFTYEPRNQGDGDRQPGYEPLQWVTEHEVRDAEAALDYLKSRPDADPDGVGFFGMSKGAGALLQAAATDPFVRCFVTDGLFATYTTLVPYMRYWFKIYNRNYVRQTLLPDWYYGHLGLIGLGWAEKERNCRFVHLEPALDRLGSRPVLMIHGGADTYIKPEMARALFDRLRGPKEFWLVDDAKHNQAFQLLPDEYRRRVLDFFDRHLAQSPGAEDGRPAGQGYSGTGGSCTARRTAPLASANSSNSHAYLSRQPLPPSARPGHGPAPQTAT